MSQAKRALWQAWIEANRAYRQHQGSCADCARMSDPVGCQDAYALYRAQKDLRLELDGITE